MEINTFFNFVVVVVVVGKDKACCVAQAGLELLASIDPSILASLDAGITGVNHCTQPYFIF